MKSMFRFFGLTVFASAFAGCAVDAPLGRNPTESVGSMRQADSADYLQTFDPYFQSIIFQPTSAIDWVILHVTIDGARTSNVVMPGTGTSAAAGPSYEIESLPVLAGDTVDYSFTYSANGLAHDTPPYRTILPASWVPPVFHTELSNGQIAAVSAKALAWADAHYTINGGPKLNVRLTPQGTTYVQPLAIHSGDVIEYAVTYSTGAAVFDTATLRYVASAAAARFVVDSGSDGAMGVCVANGDSRGRCNLRAAVLAAQATTGSATIDLSVDSTVDGGQIALTAAGPLVIESTPGGAAHAITGVATSRLFDVASGVALTLRNLSITSFRAMDQGAAIQNKGALDLEGVTIASNVTLCEDTGAMTAVATCQGGAIASTGMLTLGGGTTFTKNSVTAEASTASFTNAWAGGGAITSSGTIAIVGPVTFIGNAANAAAHSGFHPAPIGGASASASGGAVFNSGTLTVTAPAGSCRFTNNVANASGSTPNGTTTLTMRGGAIESTGTLQIPADACVFSGNEAQRGADIDE
jgi:hypothetical protein